MSMPLDFWILTNCKLGLFKPSPYTSFQSLILANILNGKKWYQMLTIEQHASDFSKLCVVSTSFGYLFILRKNARTMQNQHRVEHF